MGVPFFFCSPIGPGLRGAWPQRGLAPTGPGLPRAWAMRGLAFFLRGIVKSTFSLYYI